MECLLYSILSFLGKNWASLLSPVSVIVGWFLVHKLAISRERKAEWRKFSHSLATEIESIESLALRYHSTEDRDIKLEEDIIKRLDRSEVKMKILANHLGGIDTAVLLPFKKAVTLNNFQSFSHSRFDADSSLYKNIISTASNVLHNLYTAG